MQDPLSLLGEVLPRTPWLAALFVLRSVLIHLCAHRFVTDWIDRARLVSTIRRLREHGASGKEIRRVIIADHDARVGRSP